MKSMLLHTVFIDVLSLCMGKVIEKFDTEEHALKCTPRKPNGKIARRVSVWFSYHN